MKQEVLSETYCITKFRVYHRPPPYLHGEFIYFYGLFGSGWEKSSKNTFFNQSIFWKKYFDKVGYFWLYLYCLQHCFAVMFLFNSLDSGIHFKGVKIIFFSLFWWSEESTLSYNRNVICWMLNMIQTETVVLFLFWCSALFLNLFYLESLR